MANILPLEKQTMAIHALAEGNSIRSIERMTGIHRDTIMRLGVRVGQACAELLDEKMRNLELGQIEVDEIWGFIGKKQKQVTRSDDRRLVGDVWTCCLAPVMQPDHAAIGKMMRSKRQAESVSLRELAKRMDISAPYLGDLELGRRSWTIERLRQYLTELEKKS